MSSRGHRRADGTLRPTYRRHMQRKRRAEWLERERELSQQPDRQEWLAQFEVGARERFFTHSRPWRAVWLRQYADDVGLSEQEAAPMLERLGNERRWMKLRKTDGTVVGIAPPLHRSKRKATA